MAKYKLMCMSFDGDYVIERELFDSINNAWSYSNDLGSKWFFYPFHFVVTESEKTIAGSFDGVHFNGLRVKTVTKIFEKLSKLPENENCDVDDFVFQLSMSVEN